DGDGRGKTYLYFGPDPNPALPDMTIEGEQTGDNFGASLSPTGDVNGDGMEDLIVGAPYADVPVVDSGRVYLLLGGASLATKGNYPDLSATDADGIVNGTHLSRFGTAVAGTGDVNGDGYGDFLVGSPGKNGFQGEVALFYGGEEIASDLSNGADKLLSGGKSGDWFGMAMAGAGDVNGDGYGDFIVGGMNEKASLFLGGPLLGNAANAVIASPLTGFVGFGTTTAGAGDLNGDGFDDLLVAAPFAANGDAIINAGKIFLYLGGASLNTGADRVYVGERAYDKFGDGAARGVGDVNGDGLADLAIGAALGDDPAQSGEVNHGRAYLFLGTSALTEVSGGDTVSAGSADVIFSGEDAEDRFGGAVWREK
ncbi:MAG: FG-GAP repeat protein, partial [Nitrospirae bacterium]|nr:FG-GAP repeat protein [Nitrospirota bacterium]